MKFNSHFTIAAMAAATLMGPSGYAQTAAPRASNSITILAGKETSCLGIGAVDIDSDRAKALNLKEERGAEVSRVNDGGTADKAGIKVGDVILQYNGTPVEGKDQLQRLIRETPVGRHATIVVWRNGASQTIAATVGTCRGTVLETPGGEWFPEVATPRIAPMPEFDLPRFQMSWQNPMLGIYGESLSEEGQLADFFGVKEGVLVKSVVKNSAAERAGVKAGDVIVKIDETKVTSSSEITSALRALHGKRSFTVTVIRNKKETPLTVTMESNAPAVRAALRDEVHC